MYPSTCDCRRWVCCFRAMRLWIPKERLSWSESFRFMSHASVIFASLTADRAESKLFDIQMRSDNSPFMKEPWDHNRKRSKRAKQISVEIRGPPRPESWSRNWNLQASSLQGSASRTRFPNNGISWRWIFQHKPGKYPWIMIERFSHYKLLLNIKDMFVPIPATCIINSINNHEVHPWPFAIRGLRRKNAGTEQSWLQTRQFLFSEYAQVFVLLSGKDVNSHTPRSCRYYCRIKINRNSICKINPSWQKCDCTPPNYALPWSSQGCETCWRVANGADIKEWPLLPWDTGKQILFECQNTTWTRCRIQTFMLKCQP